MNQEPEKGTPEEGFSISKAMQEFFTEVDRCLLEATSSPDLSESEREEILRAVNLELTEVELFLEEQEKFLSHMQGQIREFAEFETRATNEAVKFLNGCFIGGLSESKIQEEIERRYKELTNMPPRKISNEIQSSLDSHKKMSEKLIREMGFKPLKESVLGQANSLASLPNLKSRGTGKDSMRLSEFEFEERAIDSDELSRLNDGHPLTHPPLFSPNEN